MIVVDVFVVLFLLFAQALAMMLTYDLLFFIQFTLEQLLMLSLVQVASIQQLARLQRVQFKQEVEFDQQRALK
jgi:hypothetical protein